MKGRASPWPASRISPGWAGLDWSYSSTGFAFLLLSRYHVYATLKYILRIRHVYLGKVYVAKSSLNIRYHNVLLQ